MKKLPEFDMQWQSLPDLLDQLEAEQERELDRLRSIKAMMEENPDKSERE